MKPKSKLTTPFANVPISVWKVSGKPVTIDEFIEEGIGCVVELAELVLEVALRTGFTEAFTHLTDRSARTADFALSLCAALLAEACNTGPEPFIRHDTPGAAPGSDRLGQAELSARRNDYRRQRHSGGSTKSHRPCRTPWGGGEIASADGMRFVVPIRTVHAGPNPKYFGPLRGMTW